MVEASGGKDEREERKEARRETSSRDERESRVESGRIAKQDEKWPYLTAVLEADAWAAGKGPSAALV